MRDHPVALHRTILVVDVADFTTRTDPARAEARAAMFEFVVWAMVEAGVEPGQYDVLDRGDGAICLVNGEVPKNRLLAGFPDALMVALLEYNLGNADPVRLRVALHAGEVIRDRHGYTGQAMELASWLGDSAEFRAWHRMSDDVLALAVTEPVHRGVVEQSSPGTDPAGYRRTVVESRGRQLLAWFRSFGGGTPPGRPPPPEAPGEPDDLHHRSILIVDIEDSSSRPDDVKREHRCRLRGILAHAISEAGIAPGQCDHTDTGDGLRVLFAPDVPKNRLIDPLVFSLVRQLEVYNRAAPERARMRLRAVLDAGELRRDHDNGEYFGSPLNEACWLLESTALRRGLRGTSGPLALMVSDEIYDGVVRHGYGAIRKEEYAAHTVALKSRDVTAWLWTPSAAGCSHDQTSA